VNAYVAATDPDWFHFLRDQQDVDEVNFWYPKPWGGRFEVLSDGQPLLFKLKSPHNHIAGGGFFKHYSELPLSIAWKSFGFKNGAPTHRDGRAGRCLRVVGPDPVEEPRGAASAPRARARRGWPSGRRSGDASLPDRLPVALRGRARGVTDDDVRDGGGEHAHMPGYYEGHAVDFWFRLFDVRRLVIDDT